MPPDRPPAAFIVGVPRSGTTLLREMLSAHPELAIPPETVFLPQAIKRWRRIAGRGDGRRPADVFLATVTSHVRWTDLHLDAVELRRRLDDRAPESVGDALRILYGLYAERAGKPRWGDKTPAYLRNMDLIAGALEEARFVHIVRDPRAVALSLAGLWFGPDSPEDAARMWLRRIRAGREQARGLAHYMEVRYEDLVRDPEPPLRAVAEHLGLPWDERMLAYADNARDRLETQPLPAKVAPGGRPVSASERARIMENVARPPDPSRIDRWRTDLSTADRRAVERVAAPLLEELGYPAGAG